MNTDHLDALNLRLSHERALLRSAQNSSPARPTSLRKVWIAQIEKEIAQELRFLGIEEFTSTLTDDELLAELRG